jgi:peroxiredoxin
MNPTCTHARRGWLTAAALCLGLWSTTAPASVAVGGPAPDFSLTDSEGKTRSLAEFRGQTVILEWTNHDCPFVKKHYDAGNMQDLQRETTAADIAWLSIISSKPGAQGYVAADQANELTRSRNAAPTAVLFDPSGDVGRAYAARTTPEMVLIDAAGTIRYMGAIDDQPSARPESLNGANNYVRAALADIAAGRPVATAQTTPYGCTIKY